MDSSALLSSSLSILLRICIYPFHLVFSILLFLFSPLLALLSFLFFNVILTILNLPQLILQKLETIYIYLGIAAIFGLLLGLIFALVSFCLYSSLNLDSSTSAPKTSKSRKSKRSKGKATRKAREEVSDVYSLNSLPASSSAFTTYNFNTFNSADGESTSDMRNRSLSPKSPQQLQDMYMGSMSPTGPLGSNFLRGGEGSSGGINIKRIFPILEEEDEDLIFGVGADSGIKKKSSGAATGKKKGEGKKKV